MVVKATVLTARQIDLLWQHQRSSSQQQKSQVLCHLLGLKLLFVPRQEISVAQLMNAMFNAGNIFISCRNQVTTRKESLSYQKSLWRVAVLNREARMTSFFWKGACKHFKRIFFKDLPTVLILEHRFNLKDRFLLSTPWNRWSQHVFFLKTGEETALSSVFHTSPVLSTCCVILTHARKDLFYEKLIENKNISKLLKQFSKKCTLIFNTVKLFFCHDFLSFLSFVIFKLMKIANPRLTG